MPGNEITTGMRPPCVVRRQMKPARQRLALERDHHRLDLVIGERRIARVAVALALVVGEIGRVVLVVRPLRRAPVDRRHEIIVARGDRRAVLLGGARLGLAAARGVGEGRLDVGVFPDALADRGEIGAALDAAGGVQIERARLVPVDADRTQHVVERPALPGPAPHLGFAFGRSFASSRPLPDIGQGRCRVSAATSTRPGRRWRCNSRRATLECNWS